MAQTLAVELSSKARLLVSVPTNLVLKASALQHEPDQDPRKSMKASRFGIKVLREFPKDAEAPSHRWLVRSGYIIQHSSGIYSYTPLFFRVFRKICAIVEQEMAAIGAQQ